MTPSDDDAGLMRRVKRGDATAFAMLVDRYKHGVVSFITRMIRDADEAEDVAQTAFVQAYRNAHRYEESARFSTWLFTIARNLCLNELRRRSRHPSEPLEGISSEHDEAPARQHEDLRTASPPSMLLRRELEAKVEEAIADLPENQREALLLCRQEDCSYEDIARILGCSVPATKSLIHRARETLKSRLKPYLSSGQWNEEDPDL
jgi:RNA polymerase sigma-70 factor (ECF subfamily)